MGFPSEYVHSGQTRSTGEFFASMGVKGIAHAKPRSVRVLGSDRNAEVVASDGPLRWSRLSAAASVVGRIQVRELGS